jgi:carboxypeptidase family protein
MNVLLRRTIPSLLSIALLVAAITANAQDLDDVTFAGKVVDSNNLAVVGATITVTETASGAERTVTTNDEGRYRVIELKPGIYKIKVSVDGFGAKERTDLETVSGQNVQLDLTLSPADVTASTNVTASEEDAPLVDTTRTVVGGTLSEREVEDLPTGTRNPLDLVLTLGGTSESALSTRDLADDRNSNPRSTPLEQGSVSLSGGASYSNNFTIDGFDNNDDRSAQDRFQPSLESVAEIQVIRNQFSAEYGRASGGRVNIRTRSGTNKFKGRAFMFFRDDNLNANSWYNNMRKYTPIPPLVPPDTNPLFNRLPFTEYNPGLTFGGPVLFPKVYDGRDRTFFFAAYEFDKFDDTTLIDTYIPVVPNPRFTLPTPNGSGQSCDVTNSPPPPCPTGVGAVSGYAVSYPTPNKTHIFTARIDHKLFDGNDLTFSWLMGRKNNRRTRGASTTRIEDALQAKNIDSDAFNITDNQVFGAGTVNQSRFQWSNYEPAYVTDAPLDPVVLIGYRNPVTRGVQTLIAGNSTASTLQDFADSRKETRFQFSDAVTHVAGVNTFKFGADIHHVNSKAIALGDATGTYNFSSVFSYSNNTLSRYRHNFGTASDVVNNYYGVFFNDEMKPVSNLTLSFGLRYEKETAVDDNNNFGPRLGIAWDPFKKGKGVVRVGGGIFYNRVLLRTVGDFIQNDLGSLQAFDSNSIPTSGTINWRTNVLASIAQDFPDGYPSLDALKAAIARATCGTTACDPNTGFLTNNGSTANPLRSVDPDLKIPESYQFNVGFEREIGKGFVFETNYTWNKTARLWREYNPNAPIAPAGYSDLTVWLTSHPLTFTNFNNSTRTYVFYQGTDGVASGLSTTPNGTTACPTSGSSSIFTAGGTCYVNLNTLNLSTTAPSTAANGVTSNSIGAPIGIALEGVRSLRPDRNFDEKERVLSVGNAFYQGLVLELRGRFRKLGAGFSSSFRAVYTLSKMKDDGLNNTTNAETVADFSREWARASQDRRHRFALSGTFETPWWMGKVRFSPIFRYGSSAPFNLGLGADRNLNDVSTDRMLFTGNLKDIRWREPGTPFPAELASQFSVQPIGAASGNLPRNAGRGPSMYLFDLSLSREWKFGERFRLRPTIEFNNILNAVVFSYGSEFVDFFTTPTANEQANFLVPMRTYRPRDIKLGIRFDF